MNAIDQLCALKDPYQSQDQLFLEAMRQSFRHHLDRCRPFANYCDGFEPETLTELERAPYLFVNVFKAHQLCSLPPEELVLRIRSSGTSGQQSQNFFDQISLDRLQAMLEAVFAEFGLVATEEITNYLICSYDPREAPDLGTAFTSTNWTRFTRQGEVVYALRKRVDGTFGFDEAASIEALRHFANQSRPVRIIGFPAFLMRVLEGAGRLQLPAGSLVLTGGGWKSYAEQEVPRQQFLERVAEGLGLTAAAVRDNYGMVEHGAPYIECEAHSFHLPVYCRAIVRDPWTLAPVGAGEVGLLQLLTPYHRALPNLSLLTSDLARLRRGCRCGRQAPVLEIVGRGGIRKHAGCAIAASQLLRPGVR